MKMILIHRYEEVTGKKLSVKEINKKKYVDAGFLNWLFTEMEGFKKDLERILFDMEWHDTVEKPMKEAKSET